MKKNILTLLKYILLSFVAFIILLPIIWMLTSSFRTQGEIFKFSSLSWELFIPVDWTLENYKEIFFDRRSPFGRYLFNTFFVASSVTILGLFVNSLAAFAFAKMK